MKTATTRKPSIAKQFRVPFPNAATRQQIIDQLVELLLTGDVCNSAAAIILLILALAYRQDLPA